MLVKPKITTQCGDFRVIAGEEQDIPKDVLAAIGEDNYEVVKDKKSTEDTENTKDKKDEKVEDKSVSAPKEDKMLSNADFKK